MGTTLDAVAVAQPRSIGGRHGARSLADRAARRCLQRAGIERSDVGLLVNAGLYHERLLGEPALAALIQEDIGANPEDPHPGHHGTFSFDVANGACGMLTALQLADGFLASGTIQHALVVASDARPGRRSTFGFPYTAAGGAIACGWQPGPTGVVGFRFASDFEGRHGDGEDGRATIGFEHGRNVLHIVQPNGFGPRAAALAGSVVRDLLSEHSLSTTDVDLVVVNPSAPDFLGALVRELGIVSDQIASAPPAVPVHTAGLAVALDRAHVDRRLADAAKVVLVSAGTGITVGAGLLVT